MKPPDFHVDKVDLVFEPVLRNLMEHYLHDMAEWFQFDSRDDGSYSNSALAYWERGFEVYLAFSGSLPIGFAIIDPAEPWNGKKNGHDVDEFFVVRKYRRNGLGNALAEHIWNLYPGEWLVRVFRHNRPALPFWRMAISAYSGGDYVEETREVDGKPWSYFSFATRTI